MSNAVAVELYYGGSWHDLTAAGEVRRQIVIATSRYGAMQAIKPKLGETSLCLDNQGGKYNPAYPLSPLYGLIGHTTPLRISVDSDVRWTGDAVAWKPTRPLGAPRYCEVTGGGVLRRLGIGTSPIMSALTAGIMALTPVIYVPLTDGPWATVAGTPIAFGATAEADGVMFGQIDGPAGDTRKLPELARDGVGGLPAWTGVLPAPTGDDWTIDLVGRVARLSGTFNTCDLLQWSTGVGTPYEISWSLSINWNSGDLTDELQLYAYTVNAPVFVSKSVLLTSRVLMDSAWHHYRVQSIHTAGLTEIWVTVDDTDTAYGAETMGGTGAGVSTISIVSASNTVITSVSVGHIAVYDSQNPGDTYIPFTGHAGEPAADRFGRICTENGIAATIILNHATDTKPMGVQPTALLTDVLYDCVVADGGIMYEDTDGNLTLRTLGTLYRQPVFLNIDVDTDVMPVLVSQLADRTIRNDVTAVRPGGSSSRYELVAGPMGTAAQRYDTQLDVNPELDTALMDYAAWLVAVSTSEDLQYGRVVLDYTANPALPNVDIGSVIELSNVSPVDDPTTPRMMVVGVEEWTDTHRRTVTLLTVPARPYDVGSLATEGWLGCEGTVTDETLDATEIGVDVLISDACAWTHADGDYNIVIGGEVMTVTAVSAVAGAIPARTQTLTVTRSVNGIVKTHATGAPVRVQDPFVLAL